MISRLLISTILFLHGALHFMGFLDAFHIADLNIYSHPFSRAEGTGWLVAGLIFILSAVRYLSSVKNWWPPVLAAIYLSELLIIFHWRDAWGGTIPNLILIVIVIIAYANNRFENSYRKDVATCFEFSAGETREVLSETDLSDLPEPLRHYIRLTGAVGKPIPTNMRVVMEGEMRNKKMKWFPFTTEQYNFFTRPARLFFMKGKMFGQWVPGYHRYREEKAVMDIRLFGMFRVAYHKGEVMNRAETVTLFNDICLMAPAVLTRHFFSWEEVNEHTVKGIFQNGNQTVGATLLFDHQGLLTNFISNDRTDITDMKNYPFSTPVLKFNDFDGLNLPAEGNGIWHYPEGPFIYGHFRIKNIEYNLRSAV